MFKRIYWASHCGQLKAEKPRCPGCVRGSPCWMTSSKMARWAPLALPSPSNTPMVVMPSTSVCWLLPSRVLLCALCKRRSKHSLLLITAAPSPYFPSPHQLPTRQTTPSHQNNCQHVCISLRASMHRSKIWQQRCLAISRCPLIARGFHWLAL